MVSTADAASKKKKEENNGGLSARLSARSRQATYIEHKSQSLERVNTYGVALNDI